jgi:hypothetical protein
VDYPVHAFVALEGEQPVAYYGLAWRFGRCDLWFSVVDATASRRSCIRVVREARRMLKVAMALGERRVFCIRDDHPNSRKLLLTVGLQYLGTVAVTLADGSEAEKEEWVYG